MDARPVTPPPQTVTNPADTPQTARMMKTLERKVERGEITAGQAWEKAQKAFEREKAEEEAANFALAKHTAAAELDRKARNGGRRTRLQSGQWFDRKYREENATDLVARSERERATRITRRDQAQATTAVGPSNFAERSGQGASRPYTERELVAFMHGL